MNSSLPGICCHCVTQTCRHLLHNKGSVQSQLIGVFLPACRTCQHDSITAMEDAVRKLSVCVFNIKTKALFKGGHQPTRDYRKHVGHALCNNTNVFIWMQIMQNENKSDIMKDFSRFNSIKWCFFFFLRVLLPELISATGGRNNPAFTVELTQGKLVISYFVHSVGIYLLIAVTCLFIFKYIQEIARLHIICCLSAALFIWV